MSDDEMLAALDRLNDAICARSRATGRGYVLILASYQIDESILMSVDGKPTGPGSSPERLLEIVRMERGEAPAPT